MYKIIYLMPLEQNAGMHSVANGFAHALMQLNFKVKSFHPFKSLDIDISKIKTYFNDGKINDLIQIILSKIDEVKEDNNFLLIQGLSINDKCYDSWFSDSFSDFNKALSQSLNARIAIIAPHNSKSLAGIENIIKQNIKSIPKAKIIGCFLTKVNYPNSNAVFSLLDEKYYSDIDELSIESIKSLNVFRDIPFLGAALWNKVLFEPRVCDIKKIGDFNTLVEGDKNRRISKISMCSRSVDNLITEFTANTLIITAADRTDIIVAACLAAEKGIKLAGLLLTAEDYLSESIIDFCFDIAHKNNLPIFGTKHKSVSTIMALSGFDNQIIPDDDTERQSLAKEIIANNLNIELLAQTSIPKNVSKMSPPAFCHFLLKTAKNNKKSIVLPESTDPRILQAAIICQEKGIANCILLGCRDELEKIAKSNGYNLPKDITVVSLNKHHNLYLNELMTIRKNKNLSKGMAQDMLSKPMYYATMMLHFNHVDGIVAGAIQTTADTVRPALQIIKAKENCPLVSSIFFMCMEDQVLIYGDCAINQDPTAEQLAYIAIESAVSAQSFGIDPKIAMISYSTGSSGNGADVEKVKSATNIIKQNKPKLVIDGPLQYDAATIKSVAAKKASNSPVAGSANVLIFPDLNTGNTVYKAVQRSANILSIGPMLQGMSKPVNDLSRGASIDDIVYLIAITAIQAQNI